MPSDAVDRFEWLGNAETKPGRLMKIRVVAPGRNWRGMFLAKPAVEAVKE
jgi:hypothetical protein